jgi:HK97 family phage prohead protease
MNRAYSTLTIKSADSEARIIRGIATTPTPDRVGDVIVPTGATFKNPLVLLHQHRHDQPVGTVTFNPPTSKGIGFEARLPVITEPGPLRDRVETAWGEVKAGLIRAVSVGFRVLDGGMERLKDGSGFRFTGIEILELSLVSVPAQSEAVISTVKSIDLEARRAAAFATGARDLRMPSREATP